MSVSYLTPQARPVAGGAAGHGAPWAMQELPA